MFSSNVLKKDLLHLIGSYLSDEDILNLQVTSKDLNVVYNNLLFLTNYNQRSFFNPYKQDKLPKLTFLQQMKLHKETNSLYCSALLTAAISSTIYSNHLSDPNFTNEAYHAECEAFIKKIAELLNAVEPPKNADTPSFDEISSVLKELLSSINLDPNDVVKTMQEVIVKFISNPTEAMKLCGMREMFLSDIKEHLQETYPKYLDHFKFDPTLYTIEKFASPYLMMHYFFDHFLGAVLIAGHTEILKLILEKHPPFVNTKLANEREDSLLQWACLGLQPKSVRCLIDHHADLNAETYGNFCPLGEVFQGLEHNPAKINDAKLILSYLLEAGADPMQGSCCSSIRTIEKENVEIEWPVRERIRPTPYQYCTSALDLLTRPGSYSTWSLDGNLEENKMTLEEFLPAYTECLQFVVDFVEKRAEKEARPELKP